MNLSEFIKCEDKTEEISLAAVETEGLSLMESVHRTER